MSGPVFNPGLLSCMQQAVSVKDNRFINHCQQNIDVLQEFTSIHRMLETGGVCRAVQNNWKKQQIPLKYGTKSICIDEFMQPVQFIYSLNSTFDAGKGHNFILF
jgi:hypothetical protein